MTKALGKAGEDLTSDEYRKLGYKLLEKNYIVPFGKQTGEIDLIFLKDKELVFVEVKTRTNTKFGGPLDSVDFYKQQKLVRTAKMYLSIHPKFKDYNMRIDVAAVDIDNHDKPVIILQNAIEDLD